MGKYQNLLGTTESDFKVNSKSVLTTDSTFSLFQGGECSVNSGNNQYLDIAAAKATILDSSGNRLTVTVAAFTKRLTGTWVADTNQGGLASGTIAANTWYYVYLMRRRTDGTLDYLVSTSNTLATYTDGSSNVWDLAMTMQILTTAASAIDPFDQIGNEVTWKTPKLEYNAQVPISRTNITLVVPSLQVKAKLSVLCGTKSDNSLVYLQVKATTTTDTTPSLNDNDTFTYNAIRFPIPLEVYTNTSKQVSIRASVLSDGSNTVITNKGFYAIRGANLTAAQSLVLNNNIIVQTNTLYFTTQLSTISTTFVDTGFALNLINPIKPGNKIRIRALIPTGNSSAGGFTILTFYRNSTTDINNVGTLTAGLVSTVAATTSAPVTGVIEFVDTPDTLTPTYNLYWKASSGTSYINRRGSASGAIGFIMITLEEIAV